MNIITKYQADEIAKFNRARINKEVFEFLKEEYGLDEVIKKVVDAIFDKIREDSAAGVFESSIEINFGTVNDNLNYYQDFAYLIERSFNHLGYTVDSIPLKNELRLFISWD